ncbi:hypothetical protein C2E23DRAFT_801214 [Lenzites betulinus]|nr:hypothetical protein C2E23DRAFT_801214 [Lenzites betulinus]
MLSAAMRRGSFIIGYLSRAFCWSTYLTRTVGKILYVHGTETYVSRLRRPNVKSVPGRIRASVFTSLHQMHI